MDIVHERQYKQMVELWFEYLKLNSDYLRACETGKPEKYAEVYYVFGDIRNVEFEDLWREREGCFERASWEAEGLRPGDDANPRVDNTDELVVVVNLYATTSDIEKKFSEILQKAKSEWTPKEPAAAKNNGHVYAHLKISGVGMRSELGKKIDTLNRVLKVYKRSLEADAKGMHRYELGADANLSLSQNNIGAAGQKAESKAMKNRRSLSSRACQDIKRAKALIHFAALGVFPAPLED